MVAKSDKLNAAARRFLEHGLVEAADPVVLAEECNRMVRAETQRSLTKAVVMARRFVKFTRRHKDRMPLQVALRCLGWALHVAGKYVEAEKAYLEARHHARRDPIIRGRIDRILIDVYMYIGDFKQARRRARLALETFKRHGADEDAAKTRINYANLFHRQDRHREANLQYRQAGAYFEKHGGDLVLGLCYYNQANTLVQLFEFEQAHKLYLKAETKFAKLGFDLYVNECQYGLAWLHMLQGDYHVALEKLARCESQYREASQPKGEMLCQLDRAEAFLGLNLFAEAGKAAKAAEARARKLGIHYEAAKAAFFYAQSLAATGREREADTALARAAEGFKRENNQAFAAAVDLYEARITTGSEPDRKQLDQIRRRFTRAQLPLWEAICDLQLLATWPDDVRVLRRLRRNPAVRTVPHLYAHWQTHLGDLDARRGRITAASHHWTQAAEVLDAVRAKLPPVEMRSAFMQRRGDPYLRLISQEATHDPRLAAAWSERHKTAGVWAATGEPFERHEIRDKAEQSLVRLADQVTVLSGRIKTISGKRAGGATQSDNALARLQKEVRQNLATIERLREPKLERFDTLLNDINRISRRQPVVQFHYNQRDLLAFVHHEGQTRSHRFVDGRRIVDEFMGCWNVLLGRSLLSSGRRSGGDIREEQRLFDEIGAWLWKPLDIPISPENILVIPEGKLSNMPWGAVIHDGLPLACQYAITLSPSLRHHVHAMRQRIESRRINLFVGESNGLSYAHRELGPIIGRPGISVSVVDPCTREDWPSNGSAWIWHYAGHAHFRSDNPFYSYLSLADGPLFAADFRLKRSKVGLVTLAACRTGNQSVLPGEESTGLVRALLEMGARNVIGSHWNVSDRSTAMWMQVFYEAILGGQPVSQSVRKAAMHIREQFPSAYDWAAFSVFGAG